MEKGKIHGISSSSGVDSANLTAPRGISKQFESVLLDGPDSGPLSEPINGSLATTSIAGPEFCSQPDIPSSQEAHQLFDELINGMVKEIYSCTICLSQGHLASNYTATRICSACGNVGHAKSDYTSFMRDNCLAWKRKSPTTSPIADISGTFAILGETANPAAQFLLPVLSSPSSPRTPSETTPLTPPPPASSTTMANFELDPLRFVPQGHNIIDEGPDRLPRTFIMPTIPITRRHEQFIVVEVMPSPPAELVAQVRQEVAALLLNRGFHVRSAQPWIEGVGLFEHRDAAGSFATVQMVPQALGNDTFVCFMRHSDGAGFRGQTSFCQGCLMLLGVPLDFRNTNDQRVVVNTFREFHHWVSDDPYLVLSIVFASFPEDNLVLRSVTFSKYAAWGRAKVSWSAPVYILGATFGEQMPNGEDPMPLNGNPHPLPGQLVNDHLLFALPPYPALGWNAVPPPPPKPEPEAPVVGGWG
ncbi:hypothetical protein D1007_20428 [Hordeum vulgare]|nr:hypothetical protein D1007_20428 [Hordeum vulgare]